MKKTLLIAAAALAAGVISSQAQVYSQNIVGYANQAAGANKLVLANNPFDNSSIPGGNCITNVLNNPNIPDSTFVYVFSAGAYSSEQYIAGYGWFPGEAILAPGTGFFIQTPSNLTNTYVGSVSVGLTTNNLVNGFTLVGSTVPQALPLGCAGITSPTNTLVFPASDGDFIYNWDVASQSYSTVQYIDTYGWYDGVNDTNGPAFSVGQGFFAQTTSAKKWIRNFTP